LSSCPLRAKKWDLPDLLPVLLSATFACRQEMESGANKITFSQTGADSTHRAVENYKRFGGKYFIKFRIFHFFWNIRAFKEMECAYSGFKYNVCWSTKNMHFYRVAAAGTCQGTLVRWHFELGMYLCFYLPEDVCQTCKTTKKIRPDMLQPFGVYFCRKLARLDNAEKIFVSFERRRKHLCT
jgi:hypothetical protein